MASKSTSEDLFGGVSDSESSENYEDLHEEWDNEKVSASVLQDLEMSCSSDDEDISQEHSQPAEPVFRQEYQYMRTYRHLSESEYSSSVPTVSTSTSNSSYDSINDMPTEPGLYEQVQESQSETRDIEMHSPQSNKEWSDLMDAAEIMTNVLPSSSGHSRRMETIESPREVYTPTVHEESSYSQTPPTVHSSSASSNQNLLSESKSAFVEEDEDEAMIEERSEANQMILNELLLGNFSEEQYDRFIAFRRSKFTRSVVKNIITEVTGRPTNDPTAVAVAGLAKLFVGEIIEEAVELRNALNQQNRPVQPHHIKSAFNKLAVQGKLWPPYGKKI